MADDGMRISTGGMELGHSQQLIPFWDAVRLVIADPSQAAFAFEPHRRQWRIVGGMIYTVEFYSDRREPCAAPWRVHAGGGNFGSDLGEEDVFSPWEIKQQEFTKLLYVACPAERARKAYGSMSEFALAALHGYEGNPRDWGAIPGWRDWVTMHEPVHGG